MINDFKTGDIVVINNPEEKYISSKNVVCELEDEGFSYGVNTQMGNLTGNFLIRVYKKEIRHATEREKFLYYIHGPHVLEGE